MKPEPTEEIVSRPSPIRLLSAWIPPIAYGGFIFYLSSKPIPIDLPPIAYFDKVSHLGAYAVLCALILRAMRLSRPDGSPRSAAVIATALTILYGISDEIHQSFIPDRYAEVLDAVSDAIGAIGTAGVYLFVRTKIITSRSSIAPTER